MSRASLFILVVLIGAAAVAGMFALAKTSAATSGKSNAAPAAASQISFRLAQLDRLEANLRQKLAQASKPIPASTPEPVPVSVAPTSTVAAARPATIYVRRPPVVVMSARHGDDESRYERESSEDRDD